MEFILEFPDAPDQIHQVKRQRGSGNFWTLRALETEGVLAAAARHVDAGREFHFVSTVPSRRLDHLADRARRSNSLEHFIDGFLDGKEITDDFNHLASAVWGTPQRAWEVLSLTRVRWPDEREFRATNSALAGMILTGDEPELAWLGLGDLILNDLGLRLSLDALSEHLKAYGLRIDPLAWHAGLSTRVGDRTAAWLDGVGAELLEPRIARGEADDILAGLTEGLRLVIATGNAGDGKSAVLHQVVERLGAEGWPLLAFRLDRLEPFRTASELGERLGLPSSPASALAALAGDGPALLVIDQLDAVSLLSGRMPASFDGVLALLREVAAFPEVRILLACREFDIQNDKSLRGLAEREGAEKVSIGPLSDEQVAAVLVELGLDSGRLDAAQLDLLRSPLHLVLLAGALPEEGALSFASTKDLFDLFWASKARAVRYGRDPAPRFTEVIDALVEAMSASQRLAVPDSELDDGDLLADADVLASEHVLVRDANRIAFFHEAFFDYAFARRWIRRGESLLQFLAASEQELFRRSQVRQVLNHLRDEDPGRFTAELVELLRSDDVRFHIKDVVLRLLGALSGPSHEEWLAVSELLSADLFFEDRLWDILRNPGWFHRLSSEGVIERWLGEEGQLRDRAIDILVSAARQHPDEAARLIAAQSSAPEYPRLLLAAARFAKLHASRELFDLLLQAVRAGNIDAASRNVWIYLHGLAKEEPEWAIEFLRAHFAERPGYLELNSEGKVADLGSRDHTQLELITDSAASRPLLFCEELLPYLLDAMAATSDGSDRPLADRHFAYRTWRADIHTVDDALFRAMRGALRALGESEPEAVARFIDVLEADPHDGAQYLLYETLAAAGSAYAERAAEILLQNESRLRSGYRDGSDWTSRELLTAIAPHLTDETMARLECLLIDYSPDREGRASHGHSAFTLLSALPEDRLTEAGRRRLGELRRKFDADSPPEPMGSRVRAVPSPIPQASARLMSDEQWGQAIARYSTGERTLGLDLRGDAEELAHVLEEEAKGDPERFAALAERFNADTHPAYSDALLRGVGDPEAGAAPETIFRLIETVAALGNPRNDRWLGWALRGLFDCDVPDQIIKLILGRALRSPDPEQEAWLTETGNGEAFCDGDPWVNGMNSGRGAAARCLADLLVHDADGHRSALIAGELAELAADRSVGVRTSVARLLSAALRFERPAAVAAFENLVDTDDCLLAAPPVEALIAHIGRGHAEIAAPTIERMLDSSHESVRAAGGRLAAYADLELGIDGLLERAAQGTDAATRRGAAEICVSLLAATSDQDRIASTLTALFEDPDEGVREAAGEVAMELRGADLQPHTEILRSLISSPAFPSALAQLLITLEASTGPIEDLALVAAERFISIATKSPTSRPPPPPMPAMSASSSFAPIPSRATPRSAPAPSISSTTSSRCGPTVSTSSSQERSAETIVEQSL